MAVISITSNANLNNSVPAAYEGVIWSSRPVKFVITVPPGNTISSFSQTAGLPMFFNFTEDTPGSGVWTSYFDTATTGTVFSPGVTTNCFDVEESGDPGNPTSFCFDIESFPNPYKEVQLLVNGGPVNATISAVTNAFQVTQITGTAIITVAANDILTIGNNAPSDLVLQGTNSATMVIQKLD